MSFLKVPPTLKSFLMLNNPHKSYSTCLYIGQAAWISLPGIVWYQQGLTTRTTQWYKGSGGCWTRARPARQGEGNTCIEKGSDNCGWIWLWWGDMRSGGGLSLRGKQVCEEVIRTLWQALHAHTKTSTRACTQTNTHTPANTTCWNRSLNFNIKLKWHPFK